jgi:NhaA family Na+:H+ antiporter
MSRPHDNRSGTTARLFGAVVRPIQAFLRLEASGGVVLLLSALAALVWANAHPASYAEIFDRSLTLSSGGSSVSFTVRQLVNDGVMTVFFFVVGMEIKRELVVGELDTVAKASLPAIAAAGGMIVPAAIYSVFNWGSAGQRGWAIPMATDIAFCIGVLTLLKGRVPHALVVFVTALAIFDDIGGILVIAFFYGHGVSASWLAVTAALAGLLVAMNRAYVVNGLAYALVGAALWYAVHHAGIHATIAGVVLGLAVPARPKALPRAVLDELESHVAALTRRPADDALDAAEILAIEEKLEDLEAPVQRFVHLWHPMVAFVIMPAFALANAGVPVGGAALGSSVALGAGIGLFAGKALGIFGFTLVAVKRKLAPMPGNATVRMLLGASVVAGIGFTVALFIATLAFGDAEQLLREAKIGILWGSFAAGLVGYAILRAGPSRANS